MRSMILAMVLVGATIAAGGKDAAFDRITLKDSGGFTGRGTGKSLVITSDGKIEAGKRGGAVVTGKLTDEQIAELGKLVAAVDWKSVNKDYRGRVADGYINSIAVTIAGKTHETALTVPNDDVPPDLLALLGYLDKLHQEYAKRI